MNHGDFQPVADAIEKKYPGDYEMGQEINQHSVNHIVIRRPGVTGRVILFEPDPSFLTSVEIDGPDVEGENIRAADPVEEFVGPDEIPQTSLSCSVTLFPKQIRILPW